MQRRDVTGLKGSVEKYLGQYRVYKYGNPGGFLTTGGNFTKKREKAAVFSGWGVAIYAARVHGFAIVSVEDSSPWWHESWRRNPVFKA